MGNSSCLILKLDIKNILYILVSLFLINELQNLSEMVKSSHNNRLYILGYVPKFFDQEIDILVIKTNFFLIVWWGKSLKFLTEEKQFSLIIKSGGCKTSVSNLIHDKSIISYL